MAKPKSAQRGYCQSCDKRTTRRHWSDVAKCWVYECVACWEER